MSTNYEKKTEFVYLKMIIQMHAASLQENNQKPKKSLRCVHGVYAKSRCRICAPHMFCKHERRKGQCQECGPIGVICEHNRQKSLCPKCFGGGLCEHKKPRNTCIDCSKYMRLRISNTNPAAHLLNSTRFRTETLRQRVNNMAKHNP